MIVTQHPVLVAQPVVQMANAQGQAQWSSNMMDCFQDTEICICGLFCLPLLQCKVASDFGECFCVPMLPGALMALRTGIRERHHIEGTVCDDFVSLWCCNHCTTCQMARELRHQKNRGTSVTMVTTTQPVAVIH
ncbi:cornifelin homolog [Lethenteron reissneri]|uniref:cornifelin homolog n=1 Tax=Lethenteron reissneri TaxID=7753 RepID=UPI002AB6BC5C|nr:cornifelin homolog [Lethenteron reissneri]XP_061432895.1 cornifelin homolog [Lethenteron reissneri]